MCDDIGTIMIMIQDCKIIACIAGLVYNTFHVHVLFCCRFYAQNMESQLEKFCEMLLPGLINLVPNSAKVMASSASTALKFIIQVGTVSSLLR